MAPNPSDRADGNRKRRGSDAHRHSVEQTTGITRCRDLGVDTTEYGDSNEKLKIIEHISLDGVIQVSGDGDFPYGDWTAPYRTPAGRDAMIAAHGERSSPHGSSLVVVGARFFSGPPRTASAILGT